MHLELLTIRDQVITQLNSRTNLVFSPHLILAYCIIDKTPGIHFKTRKLGSNSYQHKTKNMH